MQLSFQLPYQSVHNDSSQTKRVILKRFVQAFSASRCDELFLVSSSVCSAARSRMESDCHALFKAQLRVHQRPLLWKTVFQR